MAIGNIEAWKKLYSMIFSTVFFAILLVQLLVPDLSLGAISKSFLWRVALISKFNAFRYAIGDRVFYLELVGRDGWFFYTGDYSIHDYQKTELLKPNRVKYLAEVLSMIDNSAAQYGGELWVVIPPDKNTIYPQYMPEEIPVIGEISRLDQLMTYFHEDTNLNVLDLRPVFMEVSRSSQVYYKADSHWNCLGAYYASNELLAQISALYPEVQPHPLTDYKLETITFFTPDTSKAMGLKFGEETVTLTPRFATGSVSHMPYEKDDWMKVAVNSQTDLPTALVIHDSFYTTCFDQFLEPQFSRVVSAHVAKPMLSDYLTLIETEKPDVVIVEFVERQIDYFFRWVGREGE